MLIFSSVIIISVGVVCFKFLPTWVLSTYLGFIDLLRFMCCIKVVIKFGKFLTIISLPLFSLPPSLFIILGLQLHILDHLMRACVCVCVCVCVYAKSLQSCSTLCNPTDHSLPGSSVYLTLQVRILNWVAMPSSRGSSQPRVEPVSLMSPALAGRLFTTHTSGVRLLDVSSKSLMPCSIFHCVIFLLCLIWIVSIAMSSRKES